MTKLTPASPTSPARFTQRREARGLYPGAGDQPSPERVVAHGADGGLVAVEGHVALAVLQAEDAHCAVLVTHGDVDAVGRGAEEGHLVLLAPKDQDLREKQKK